MPNRELIEILNPAKPPRVLVVGDFMLDRYIWGTSGRISPEAPVLVVKATDEEERVGGAGNVCSNLAAMGAKVTAVGVVGRDEAGQTLRRLLQEQAISTAGLVTTNTRPTTRKSRIIAQHQHLLRIDREDSRPLQDDIQTRVAQHLKRVAKRADVILVSDYAKGLITPDLMKIAVAAGRSVGIPVVVDPKAEDFRIYRGATVIKPNLNEFRQAILIQTGKPLSEAERPDTQEERRMETAGKKLLKQLQADAIVVTLGKDGMQLIQQGKRMQAFETQEQETFDVTGAGDTALAAIGFVLAGGHALGCALQIANVAAGAAVTKVGTAPVGRTEIIHRLEDLSHQITAKTKTLDDLVPLLNARRSRKQKIVFTNGCFDVLHVGHIGLLKYARKQGDLLVVGLNSDASIARLKGPGRPILQQLERAQILAALEDVDYIVIFDQTSVLPVVKRVRPDILVKGADYQKSEVVGQAFVETYGGIVRRAPLVEGISTTNIVNKIKDKK